MIDVRSVFDQFIKNYICIKHIITEKLVLVKQIITQLIAYLILNIPKETKSWLLYILSKQQALDADPKDMQQIKLIGNLDLAENTTIFFIIE